MIDQFGRTVKPGDIIVWAHCRSTKFRKHHIRLMKGTVIHIDTKAMWTGHIAETILAEKDFMTANKSHRENVLLVDPDFVIIESNSS